MFCYTLNVLQHTVRSHYTAIFHGLWQCESLHIVLLLLLDWCIKWEPIKCFWISLKLAAGNILPTIRTFANIQHDKKIKALCTLNHCIANSSQFFTCRQENTYLWHIMKSCSLFVVYKAYCPFRSFHLSNHIVLIQASSAPMNQWKQSWIYSI